MFVLKVAPPMRPRARSHGRGQGIDLDRGGKGERSGDGQLGDHGLDPGGANQALTGAVPRRRRRRRERCGGSYTGCAST
ncbi:hypothetical protein [Phytohabitans suffuscus]|uniref:hypothetical protein n=1 Tax=Phytohabitans suffuscus TaxID=624315 RepID=UPI001565028B|nr:hypothetical protein [Phytohabitans suffuscus]